MSIRTIGCAALLLTTLAACGGAKKDPNDPSAAEGTGDTSGTDTSASTGSGGDSTADAGAPAAEGDKPKGTSVCSGFDLDLVQVLGQSACELAKPASTAKDLKNVVDVKVTSSAAKVAPGGHVDLVATFTNKSKDTVALQFTLDPTARFSTEAYDKKGNRADMPTKAPPALPDDIASRAATAQSMAEIKIVAGGSAHVQLGWDAVKMTWAPEKVRGTPPEMGYPRKPAGALAKGKYRVHLVTPLTNVSEGIDKEFSSPAVEIEVGK
ncbi:MAG TPA: hypothetical protein VF407_01975 [Polyangiaceae bacterium]